MYIFKDVKTIWHENPVNSEAAAIFGKSDYLFFPSENEGLGLPIIEAQVHGCRVIIKDKAPMSDLAMDGAFFLSESPTNDAIRFENEYENIFDKTQLINSSRNRFCNPTTFGEWWNSLMC